MLRRVNYPTCIAPNDVTDVIFLDVNVNGIQRDSYANDVDFLNFDAGTTAILNIGCASIDPGATLRVGKATETT